MDNEKRQNNNDEEPELVSEDGRPADNEADAVTESAEDELNQ